MKRPRRLRRTALFLRLRRALSRPDWPHSHPLLKKSLDFARSNSFFRSNLGARPRFCSPRVLPGRPGPRFSRPKQSFFRGLSLRHAVRSEQRPTSTKHWQEWYETHIGASAQQAENGQKSIRRCFRLRLATRTAPTSVLRTLPERSGAFLARLERPRGALGGPGAVPRTLRGRPGRAFSRPWGVPTASRSVPEATRIAPNRPRSILYRFLLVSDRFFVDFWAIVGRFRVEIVVCLFVCSFVSSFVRLRIRSFMRSFVRMFVHSFVHLRLRSHDPSFERSIYVAYIQSPPSSLYFH